MLTEGNFGSLVRERKLPLPCTAVKELPVLLLHLLVTIAKLLGPGGAKAVAAH